MSEGRAHDDWDDARIDRVLRDAMAVEPSPALRARVRARIVDEPRSSVWWVLGRRVAMGAAAVILMMAFAGLRWWTPAPPSDTMATSTVLPRADAVAPVAPVPPVDPSVVVPSPDAPSTTVLRVRHRAPFPSAADDDAPQFDPADRAAFERFITWSRSAVLADFTSLPLSDEDETSVVAAIEIPVIEVLPIAAASDDEGVPEP
ncbi:MAG: hypothetical protein IT178_19045 [Acidobacteria bacterium]|nr:hypothetical protein [Acidobacteriota bacterium]